MNTAKLLQYLYRTVGSRARRRRGRCKEASGRSSSRGSHSPPQPLDSCRPLVPNNRHRRQPARPSLHKRPSSIATASPATTETSCAGRTSRGLCSSPSYAPSGSRSMTSTSTTSPSVRTCGEKVVRKLRVGAMPPQPRPRPDKATYDAFRTWLEDELDRAADANPHPGRTQALHRLNRTEYRNVIRDLLDLDIDVDEWIPADAPDRHGFDNNAGALSLSPALLGRYVSAALKISRLAIGSRPAGGAVIQTYDLPLNLIQNDRQSEDLPFGSRGGAAIHHHFPVDGEYVIKIRLETNYVGYVRGMDAAHTIEMRLDGKQLEQFTVGGEAPGMPSPISFAGNIRGDEAWEFYTLHADDPLEVRVHVAAGPHVIGVSFRRETWEPDGVMQPRQTGFALAINDTPDGNPALGKRADQRPLYGRRTRRHADPPEDLFLQAGHRRRRAPVRPGDPVDARAARVSPAGDRRGGTDADRLLRGWSKRGELRSGRRLRAGAAACGPRFPLSHRTRSRRHRTRDRLPRDQRRACLQTVLLPLEQHSR